MSRFEEFLKRYNQQQTVPSVPQSKPSATVSLEQSPPQMPQPTRFERFAQKYNLNIQAPAPEKKQPSVYAENAGKLLAEKQLPSLDKATYDRFDTKLARPLQQLRTSFVQLQNKGGLTYQGEYEKLRQQTGQIQQMIDGWRNEYRGDPDAMRALDIFSKDTADLLTSSRAARTMETATSLQNLYTPAQKLVDSLLAVEKEGGFATKEAYDAYVNQLGQYAEYMDGDRTRFYGKPDAQSGIDKLHDTLEKLRTHAEGQYYRGMIASKIKDGEDALEKLQNGDTTADERAELRRVYYLSLFYHSDFEEKSTYKSTANGKSRSDLDLLFDRYEPEKSGYDDPWYEYINGNTSVESYLRGMGKESYGEGLGALYAGLAENSGELAYFTDDERKIYNYLYATKGKNAAEDFVNYLSEDLNLRQRIAYEDNLRKYANEHPIISSIGSVATSPLKTLSYVGQLADYIPDGKMEKDAAYNLWASGNAAVRQEVSSKVEKNWGSFASGAYNIGMGLADFLFTTAATGGNKALSLAIMGTSAAADATLEAKDRGLSDDQAFALGTIAGATEIAMEFIPLDNLLKTNQSKSWLVAIIKQGLSEAGEEVGSELVNTIADIIISQDKSRWELAIQGYLDSGEAKNRDEAFQKAFGAKAFELLNAAAGGFMSGGMLGASAYGINVAVENHRLTNMDADGIISMIDEGLAAPKDTDSYRLATYLQNKADSGETLTVRDLRALDRANATVSSKQPDTMNSPENPTSPTPETGAAATPSTADPHFSPAGPINMDDVIDESMAQLTGAPADPVAAALDTVKAGGTVSNNQARDILNNLRAIQYLQEKTGMKLIDDRSGGTASSRRAAVKEAIAQLAVMDQAETVDTAPESGYDNQNTTGGTTNAQQQTSQIRFPLRSPEASLFEAPAGASAQNGNGPGVQREVGENGGGLAQIRSDWGQRNGLTDSQEPYAPEDYVQPENSSPLHQTQEGFGERGIDCKVVHASKWGRENPAFTRAGKVYISDGIDPVTLSTAIPHEESHVMLQTEFMPYLDFIDRTPDMMKEDGEPYQQLLHLVSKHTGIDIFSMDESEYARFYDELNAIVYGMEKAGILADPSYAYGDFIPDAFNDFDGYIKELDSIHDQFAQQAKAPYATKSEAELTPTGEAPETGSLATSKSSASDNSIPDSGENVNPTTSVGAAPGWFDLNTRLQYEHGTIPEGENPVRPADLPKKDYTGKDVSKTAATVKGAKVTPDEFVDLLNKETVEGGLSYVRISNDAATQKATEYITEHGWELAKALWENDVVDGKAGAVMDATGALLLNNAASAGDHSAWRDILFHYQMLGTNTAQGMQALRILKTLEPSDKLYMIKRSVQQMSKDTGLDLTIAPELVNEFDSADTDKGRDDAIDKIKQDIADQIPSTFMEKWNALRYVNMLGNLKTQGRNILGNLSMKTLNATKNAVAVVLENIAYKVSGGKFERTKSLAVSKELLSAAKADFAQLQSVIMGGGKMGATLDQGSQFAQDVQDKRRILGVKGDKWYQKAANAALAPLEGYRKVTNWAMEKGDLVFSRSAYARSLAGYLKAHGVTDSDLSKVDTELMDKARLYAVKEAQEVTFRDSNRLSDWISKIGRRKNTHPVGKVLAEGAAPFRKTPANVLLRAEEYSPLGIINSVGTSIKAMQKGSDITGAQVINSWSKTLTGTGIFLLGMLLNNLGVLTAGPDEDDDKEAAESMNGQQNYALTIPGTDINITIDVFSSVAMPMLMGAELMEICNSEGFELKDLESSLMSIADPMIQMSMLQGVDDILTDIKYSDGPIGRLVETVAVNYLMQGMTNSLLGQLERGTEDVRMTTYTDENSPIPKWLQYQLGKASAKTPGWDYHQTPYINAKGEEEKNPSMPQNLLYNTLSPVYIEQNTSTDMDKELDRLNDAQSNYNVYLRKPSKSLTVDGEEIHLSADQYDTLCRTQGQNQVRLVEDIMNLEEYEGLTDDQKAKLISEAYDYARELSKSSIDIDGKIPAYIRDRPEGMSEAEAILRQTVAGTTTKYTDVPIDTAAFVAELMEGLQIAPRETDADGKPYTNVRPIQKMEAVVESDELDAYVEKLLPMYMKQSTQQRYQTALDEGYTSDEFVAAYRLYLDRDKELSKTRQIKELAEELDMDYRTAKTLWEIYSEKPD
ncbi:MAG: hypothetical protein E7466_06120 [Ruminococcaceae bacterium]|nr:hypothetical protein [Oscillospiraceae bacterium]